MVASERRSPWGWGLGTRPACEHVKKYTVRWELRDRENQVEDQHDDERWRLGRVHILAWKCHSWPSRLQRCMVGLDHVYFAYVLNKPCSSTGRKYALNKRLITRVYGMLIFNICWIITVIVHIKKEVQGRQHVNGNYLKRGSVLCGRLKGDSLIPHNVFPQTHTHRTQNACTHVTYHTHTHRTQTHAHTTHTHTHTQNTKHMPHATHTTYYLHNAW